MSFLGGGDASCGPANPLSQFSKHVQDDKSLQRDRLVGRGPSHADSFRSRQQNGAAPDMMNEFMQQPDFQGGPAAGVSPIELEALRREFDQIHPSQRSSTPQSHNWAAEFDPAHQTPAFPSQAPQAFNNAEFQKFVEMRTASPATPNGSMSTYQRPMGMGYGGMYGGGYGMGMGMGMSMMGRSYPAPMEQQQQQQQQPQDVKGKGRMVELDDHDWEAQFAQLDVNEQAQMMEAGLDEKAMEDQLNHIDRAMADEEAEWQQHAGEEWDNFDMNAHLPRDPEMGNYMFEEENPFKQIGSPFEEGVRIMDAGGNLSLAALAFEAAVQQDSSHIDAWTRLGAAQAQNEKETPAIRALEQAVKLDPGNLDALMGLAVSYTNEGYDSTAYRTLERWLSYKYPAVIPPEDSANLHQEPWNAAEVGFTDRHILHQRVTDLFIKAAQLSPDAASMDPDVQVGLGVLFYGAEEYDKAVDCFSAALASNETGSSNSEAANQRPLLWNRLGATLANSGRSEEAIDAYEKALELNPSFVRARYNLGVSCINIGCYAEAAQHLLGALAMHKVAEQEGREKARELVGGGQDEIDMDRVLRQNQSTNLFDTLRRVFGQMDRRDLAEKVGPGMDVESFRREFEF